MIIEESGNRWYEEPDEELKDIFERLSKAMENISYSIKSYPMQFEPSNDEQEITSSLEEYYAAIV